MASVNDGVGVRRSLVDRVKAILLKPRDEWAVIDGETTPIPTIYTGYVMILAAIGPVCQLIGSLLFGYGAFGIVFRPSITSALSSAIIQYVLSLVMVYVLALIIDALAPSFNGTKSRLQAFKVAAYASTASWVGGVFGLIPQLSILAMLAGLYSLYLLYMGLPRLMKVAQDRAIAFTACIVLAAIVLFLVLGAITSAITAAAIGMGNPLVTTDAATGAATGTVSVPGMGSVDLSKLEAASKQMAAAATAAQAPAGSPAAAGAIVATPPATLQNFLPAALPGLARTAVSSSSAGAAGFNGSTAEATYGADGKTIKLSVTDMGAAGAFAAMGSALNVQSSSQDANGYEKVATIDKRMTTEKWDAASRSATYSVMVGNRFMVSGDGDGVDMAQVKGAVAGIDANALERLVK